MKLKTKKCRSCKNEFTPFSSTAIACSWSCASLLAAIQQQKKEAKVKAQKKKDLMPKSEWVKLAQQVFNKFIRLRDKNMLCISCETYLDERKYDAGHYFSCGAYPGLRFDEDNVHGQCVACNQHRHGNISEYVIRLPNRIGNEAYEALQARRGQKCQYSIPELKELIENYKLKIKQLN